MDLFSAAIMTTQSAVMTSICHVLKNRDSMLKIRQEFEDFVTKKIAENPKLKDMDKYE